MYKYMFLFFALLIALYCIFNGKSNKGIYMEGKVDLHFGMQGVEDFRRYSYGDIDQHPAGAGFRTLWWRAPNLGKVRIITEKSDLEIAHIERVMGTDFTRFKGDGIQTMDITGYLHSDKAVTVSEAYEGYVQLMQELNKKGWKQHFYFSKARIDKRDNFRHMREHSGVVIDPTYILSYEEWEKHQDIMHSAIMNLHNNGVQLGIILSSYEPYNNDKEGHKTYSVIYTFQTHRYTEKNSVRGAENMDYEEFEAALIKRRDREKESRISYEEQMKEKGYRIDEEYVDPDIWQYVK